MHTALRHSAVAFILLCGIFLAACGDKGTTPNPTPTPAVSPSPTASPTPSPTASPSASPTPISTPTPAGTGFNIGMNLEGLSYWMAYAPYVDMAYALCGNDDNVCWDNQHGAVQVDANGYPTAPGATAATWAPFPAGTYSVSWDGAGAISVSAYNGTAELTNVTRTGGHVTATLTTTHSNPAERLQLTFTVTSVPISNLHILAPASSYAPGHIYLDEFLRRIRPFSTFRFMDPLRMNGSHISHWSERAFPGEFSHARNRGIVYEDIVALANETGKDVWIDIPVRATDDYICRMARLFRYGEPGDKSDSACDPSAPGNAPAGAAGINANSHLYVEYSNELWNYGFEQAHDLYCMTNGHEDPNNTTCPGPTAPISHFLQQELAKSSLPWDNSNGWAKADQAHAVMLVNISRIFNQVFSDRPGQVRVIAGSQCAGSAWTKLEMLKNGYGENAPQEYLYAVAVAPYVDLESDDDLDPSLYDVDAENPPADLDLSSIFASMQTYLWTRDTSKASIYQWISYNVSETAQYGLPVIAYEGGPGLTANQHHNTYGAKYLAQSDPRMRQVIFDMFSIWDQFAGKDHPFVYYTYATGSGVWGYWGALEDTSLPGSTKWDALLSLALPPGDANLDGAVDAQDCAILQSHFGESGRFWEQGDFNHDGVINAADLALMNANITGASCAVP